MMAESTAFPPLGVCSGFGDLHLENWPHTCWKPGWHAVPGKFADCPNRVHEVQGTAFNVECADCGLYWKHYPEDADEMTLSAADIQSRINDARYDDLVSEIRHFINDLNGSATIMGEPLAENHRFVARHLAKILSGERFSEALNV